MWSSPVTITPPAAEPIGLVQAKQYLRLEEDDTGFDDELALQIAGARSHIEAVTNTRLIHQTIELGADSFADLERLPIGPISSLLRISYRDSSGDQQALESGDVELVGAGLEMAARPVAGTWPAAAKNIKVRAVVGYGTDGGAVPPSVTIAVLQQIRALFNDSTADIGPWLVNHRIWL